MIFDKKTINNYGVGKKTKMDLLEYSGLNKRNPSKRLMLKQQSDVERKLQSVKHGKKLKDAVKDIVSFLSKIKTYKGVRHKLGYPVRGQRTHTNAKTKKSKF